MSKTGRDDFYVGYLPKAPAELAKWLRSLIVFLIVAFAAVSFGLVSSQMGFYPSVFEFQQYKEFEGVIAEQPYPMLLVERPGNANGESEFSAYYLTVFGKFGANEAVAGLDGKRVKMEGALIYRDGQTMIEIKDGSISALSQTAEQPGDFFSASTSLGKNVVVGEIVDSKCFLGVMNPGSLKPHKSCAIRCISGGAPPVLIARDPDGKAHQFLLTSPDGKVVNKQVLDMIAEPVAVTGEIVKYRDMLVLKADPASIVRLNSEEQSR